MVPGGGVLADGLLKPTARPRVRLILIPRAVTGQVAASSDYGRSDSISTICGSVQRPQRAAVAAACCPRRVELECGRPADGSSKAHTGRGTTRWMEVCLCYPPSTGPAKGAARWSLSDSGWLFRSRGHGSITRSRILVAGSDRDEDAGGASSIALASGAAMCHTNRNAHSSGAGDDGMPVVWRGPGLLHRQGRPPSGQSAAPSAVD
ncbi:hypothetical protein BU26DRAFT_508343 [Trematosphaeria pertusa]|uniref:Uncharacterized protein n=1 Tax=Trematosphaeria pertusa TaxID=390896 RepID=A0A6A6I5E2_9PLEO|nr:uncharacterized protein BU26DRAFT_508343 [Trematosphaeria pertusa]KAF2245735.1 hypothetical protein BU26DRAFT_508343 [Trematosphaeria pertusa]